MKLPELRVNCLIFLTALSVFVTQAGIYAQGQVSDFSAGQSNGTYSFASATPKTFGELFKGRPQSDSVTATGHLFLPPSSDKVPAVLLLHGSGGIYSAMLGHWPEHFNSAGYAVFSVDSFGPRGVKNTAENQALVPFAADVADAFAALRLLATHPRIDAKRIAVMGFSRGGIAAWRVGVERLIAAQKLAGLRFAAHIPMYSGGCVGEFRLIPKPGVFSKAPMLWVHGDKDDYTPIAPCQDYADRIAKAGTPVEFVVIPGASHKFDDDDTKRHRIHGAQITLEKCPIEIDISNFTAFDRFTGEQLRGEAYQKVLKESCRSTGATVEGNRSHRASATDAALAFLRKVFGS